MAFHRDSVRTTLLGSFLNKLKIKKLQVKSQVRSSASILNWSKAAARSFAFHIAFAFSMSLQRNYCDTEAQFTWRPAQRVLNANRVGALSLCLRKVW